MTVEGSGQLSLRDFVARQELRSRFGFCGAPGERFCYLSVRVHTLRDVMRVLVVNSSQCQLKKLLCCTTSSMSINTAVTDVFFQGHEWLRSWECNLKQNDCGLYLGLSQQREFRSLVASTRSGFTVP